MIKPIEPVYRIVDSYYFFNPIKSNIQNKLLNTRIKIAGLSFREHLGFILNGDWDSESCAIDWLKTKSRN